MSEVTPPAGERAGRVHVWTADLLDDDAATAEFACLLDEGERERARCFRFDQQRRYFIQSHGVVRRILARYTGIEGAALRFRHGPQGKPSMSLPGWESELHFSLSHSAHCCMVAVRSGGPVGIDVEQIGDLPNAAEIANRAFSRAESGCIGRLAGTARRDGFFALWTAKEAVVKALGYSLADYLDRVQFDLDPSGRVRFISLDGDRALPQTWSVRRIDAPAGFAAAVAGCPGFETVQHFTWKGAGRPVVNDGDARPSWRPEVALRVKAPVTVAAGSSARLERCA